MAAFADYVPTMVGGAADLSESTKTEFPGGDDQRYTRDHAHRNVFFGVREHGMGASVNGMCAHGGIVRPYGSTFLQFADYMRGAVRLSALTALPVAWVYTHDSVGLGEDGPTHQPVEHLAALRAIPGLTVIRPGDANETAAAWRTILEDLEGPAVLVLSRQDLPVLADASDEGVARGAYVLRDPEDAAGRDRRDGLGAVGRDRGGRPARRRRRSARGSCRCRAGSCSPPRTRPTATRSCRPACRRSRSRRGSARAGSAGSTARSRSTASAPRRPGRRSSSGSGSRRTRVAGAARRAASRAVAAVDASARAALSSRGAATVTWIAPGSRTQAIMFSAVSRSSMNWNASAWARER